MTVAGIGIDLVDVAGFAEQLATPGSRFEAGVFSDRERASTGGQPERLAARWAAKEAFIKAWSASRFGRPRALEHWDPAEIEVIADAAGRPGIQLHGAVAAAVDAAFGDNVMIHLSISHDGPGAAAIVILEVPDAGTTSEVER